MRSPLLFQEVQQALLRAGSPTDAAECHGTLCGLLCARHGEVLDEWLAQTLPDASAGAAVTDCRRLLETLHEQTRGKLGGVEMAFIPLLPGDDDPLEERVLRLRHWCQGFLYGLGVGDVRDMEKLPPDVREAVGDMAEIARVAITVDEDDEEDEEAWAELLEFVRVATQLVHDEMNPPRPAQFTTPPGIH